MKQLKISSHSLFSSWVFKELEDELKNHELALFLCTLANAKGKVTLFFLLQGLEKLAHFQEVKTWMTHYNISQEQIQEILQQLQIE